MGKSHTVVTFEILPTYIYKNTLTLKSHCIPNNLVRNRIADYFKPGLGN